LHQRIPQNLWISLWIDDGQEYLSIILQELTETMKFQAFPDIQLKAKVFLFDCLFSAFNQKILSVASASKTPR